MLLAITGTGLLLALAPFIELILESLRGGNKPVPQDKLDEAKRKAEAAGVDVQKLIDEME
jgi:hypothetical protein